MYTISQKYEDYLAVRRQDWRVKVDVEGVEYDHTKVVEFDLYNSVSMGQQLELGRVELSTLEIELRTVSEIPANAKMVPYLALDGPDGLTEWLPMGEFFVDRRSQSQSGEIWRFVCLDKLVFSDVPYVSGLVYPATMQAVWNEIMTLLDYEDDDTVVIDSVTLPVAPTGYSCRQVISYISAANAASVYVGKDGKIKFRRYHAADQPVKDFRLGDYVSVKQLNPIKTFTRFVVELGNDDDTHYEAGAGDENHTLHVHCPFGTQGTADGLLTALNGFSYVPVEIDVRGFPQLEAGDRFEFWKPVHTLPWNQTDPSWKNMPYTWEGELTGGETVALFTKFSFRGGLGMHMEAPSKSAQQSEFKVDNPLGAAIKRLGKNAVKLTKPYYGVTITQEAGLTVERSDNQAKAVLNADELAFYKGSSKALWFDADQDKYKFNGTLEAADGVFSGSLSAATGTFAGALSAATGTFAGSLSAASGTFTGALQGGTIAIGSGSSIFKADANGIYLGNASFGSAPFRVGMNGQLTATGANLSGNITMTGGSISWANVNTDPVASGAASAASSAQGTASSALSVAAAIANGNYSGGSFISERFIYSPTIVGTDIIGTSTITGGIIRTAASGTRVQINNNSLKTYNSSNNLQGFAWGTDTGSLAYGDAYFYTNGTKRLEFYNNVTNVIMRPTTAFGIILGDDQNGHPIYCTGNWSFFGANVAGLTAKFS